MKTNVGRRKDVEIVDETYFGIVYEVKNKLALDCTLELQSGGPTWIQTDHTTKKNMTRGSGRGGMK